MPVPSRSRRRFLQQLVQGLVALVATPYTKHVKAQANAQVIPVLSGAEFDLTISHTLVNISGEKKYATTINLKRSVCLLCRCGKAIWWM
ncbi:MAG: hypothetical protein FJ190_06495 [Gammaproteobacteria bacterium]|nr:hypothetical protein [Gammaproteobacteria bacterium]